MDGGGGTVERPNAKRACNRRAEHAFDPLKVIAVRFSRVCNCVCNYACECDKMLLIGLISKTSVHFGMLADVRCEAESRRTTIR